MYNAVSGHGDKNLDIIKSIPAFLVFFLAFKGITAAIVNLIKRRSVNNKGGTTDKNVLREELINEGTIIAGMLYSYASATKNNTLKAKVDYSNSKLRDFSDEELGPHCQIILEAGQENVAQMADYSLTNAMLEDYKALAQEFDQAVPGPRNNTTKGKTMGTSLTTLFKESDELLADQMDRLALAFKKTHPEFYQEYLNNRTIVDAGTRNTKATGTATDKTTGKGIRGVLVEVEGKEYTAISKLGGGYALLIPVPGVYTLIFIKAGFRTVKVAEVEVKLGQAVHIDIVMEPV